MRPSIFWNRVAIKRVGVVAGVAVCALFAYTLAPTLAAPAGADPTPTTTAPASAGSQAQGGGARLERLYGQEQKLLAAQKTRLDTANSVVTRAQDRINTLKGRGIDTSKIEAALSAFKSAVASAQTDYDSAKGLLDAHAGFDGNGNVTDMAQARNTVKSVGEAERQFHQTAREAATDLRQAVRIGRIDLGLKSEQARLAVEQKRLDQANALVGKAQDRINALKGQGKDTSALETALSSFKNALGSAQTSLNSAKSTLDAHTGFDANGNVTDEAQARATLQAAGNSEQQFRQTVRQALSDVRKALQQYRADNKPQQ